MVALRAVVLRAAAVPVAVVRRPDPAEAEGLPLPGRFPEATQLADAGRRARAGRVDRQGARARSSTKQGNRTLATIEIERKFAPSAQDARAILRQKTLLGETYVGKMMNE